MLGSMDKCKPGIYLNIFVSPQSFPTPRPSSSAHVLNLLTSISGFQIDSCQIKPTTKTKMLTQNHKIKTVNTSLSFEIHLRKLVHFLQSPRKQSI